MTDECRVDGGAKHRTLWIVLLLNLGVSLAFFATGLAGDSSALIANGVDNLSDAFVYLLSLIALGRAAVWKNRAATVSGIMLLLFATPLFAGFANAILPLQLGAPDVAFPRLNAFAFWPDLP